MATTTPVRPKQQPWSASRVKMFQECRRKYYLRYHLAPLARRPGAPELATQADRIKDLIGVEAWAGNLVHDVIEVALNRWRVRKEYDEAQALKDANERMSSQLRSSFEYWNAHPDSFTRRPALLDQHYYAQSNLTREQAVGVRNRVHQCLSGFFRSTLAERIRTLPPNQIRPIDRNAAAHLEDGTLILVKPDFAYVDYDDRLHILDWKTGRSDPYWEMVQVTCYALYASQKWDFPLDRIDPQVVHLYPEFRLSHTEYSWESIEDVRYMIRESQDEILDLLDGDELPPADRFPPADDNARCRWCQFRGICEGAQRPSGTGEPESQ